MAFPLSPSNGQVTAVNGIVYTYDLANEAWYRSGATSANLITTDTANVTSNTSSVSTSTGALRVGGGAGIAGNLWAGNVYSTNYFYANGAAFTGGTGAVGYTGSAGVGYVGSTGYTGSQGVGYTGSAGIAAGTFTATAAGAITAGRAVVLNANASVSAAGQVVTSLLPSSSYPSAGSSNGRGSNSIAYDSTNNRVYVAYYDASSGTLKVVVGTPGTGTNATTTWGTPANSGISINNTTVSCAFDTVNSKLVVTFGNSSNAIQSVVCSYVAGPSVTFGTPTTIVTDGAYSYQLSRTTYDVASGNMLVVYKRYSASYLINAIVGTVSGTTISFGTGINIYTSATYDATFDVTYNSTGSNHVAAIADGATGSAYILTILATSVSVGSAAIFRNSATNMTIGALSTTYDSGSQRILVAHTSTTNVAYVSVGSISGTAITFGTATTLAFGGVFSAGTITAVSIAYDASVNRTDMIGSSSSASWMNDAIVSDLTFTEAANTQNIPQSTSLGALIYMPMIFLGGVVNQVMALLLRAATDYSIYSVLIRGYSVTTNAGSYFGLAAGTYTNGQAATITVLGGVNTNQTGLTANVVYYVAADGTLTSTAPGYGKVGVALSATTLLVNTQTITGYTGSTGSQGIQGNIGYTGSRGLIGYTGSSGVGYVGSIGYTGSAGVIGYTGSAGTGGGGNTSTSAIFSLPNTVTSNTTLASGNNAMSVGPITVNTGVSVTVPSGQRWVIL